MSYDNNVPLGNQTIAQTTDLIRGNFAFLQTNLQAEHSFNGNVGGLAEGAHRFCAMPNAAVTPALPAGADGIYLVRGNLPYFSDGTTDSLIGNVRATSGINTIATGNSFQILAAGNYMGVVNAYFDIATSFTVFQFNLKAGVLLYSGATAFTTLILDGGNNLKIRYQGAGISPPNATYTWQVIYAAAP